MHCDEACAASRYPTSYFLLPAPGKGEDKLVIDHCRYGHRSGEVLWAVFDGHRGKEVAGHASKTVPGLYWFNAMNGCGPAEALQATLQKCHEMARKEQLRSGSTAVVVTTVGDSIWCASAGDSRVVAALHGGGVVCMSRHHHTSSPEEVARIQASGGNLEWGRLGGFMPVTRGLGNFDLEACGFSSIADVSSLPRRQVEFVVIASDGLWDHINDEDCCRLIRQWGPTASAERLAYAAQQQGSSDDIAVIICRFPPEGVAAAHMGA